MAGERTPPAGLYASLADDLRRPDAQREIAAAARRLNYEIAGYRMLLQKTADALSPVTGPVSKEAIIAIDKRWNDPAYWMAMKRATPAMTLSYLLAAVDLRQAEDGSIVPVPSEQARFVAVLARTPWISAVVTAICLLIAFPVAFHIADSPPRRRSLYLLLVLLPFWTSLLVRTRRGRPAPG